MLLNSVVLLGVFALVDRHFVKKEGREGEEALELEEEAVERVPVRIEGLRNLWYLALIIVAVVLNGAIPQTRECLDPGDRPRVGRGRVRGRASWASTTFCR